MTAARKDSPKAIFVPKPIAAAPSGPDSQQPKDMPSPTLVAAAAPNSPKAITQAQPILRSPSGASQPPAMPCAEPRTSARVVGQVEQRNQMANDTQGGFVSLFDPSLDVLACAVGDIEQLRIALANRIRGLTATEPDSDGVRRGFGLDSTQPAVAALATQLAQLEALEHGAVLAMKREFRKHPLAPWVKAQIGMGEKQTARLLSAIKDPYWNDLHDRPRTVSELWAFSGLHVLPAGVAPRRARGQAANWNNDARTRAYVIAESCMKNRRSPYRSTYDEGRTKYADTLHATDCRQCKATAGEPLRDGHKHARAMRLVMKAILRDLWIEAKRIHEETS